MDQRTGELKQEWLPGPGQALVYSEQYFEGRSWPITSDTPYLGADFSALSIQIGPQTGVTIFSEENYGGISQNLTTDLAAFTNSRLGKDLQPKSLKIWSTVGKKFTGYWAIEIAAGQYLSVGPDGVLTASTYVSEKESFRIKDVGHKPGIIAFSVWDGSHEKARTSGQSQALTIADLQSVALHNEPEAGFRKFSLLAPNGQWIYYEPTEKRFLVTTIQKDRAIFCQAIKIAEDESQVGELRQGEVALYENRAYWGKAWVFYMDCPDFANIVGLTGKVSSIQLGLHTGITIYREALFNADKPEAAKQDVTADLPSLEYEQVSEDQLASMRFWKIVSPEGTGISFTCKLSQDFRGSGTTFKEYSAYRTTLQLPRQAKFVDVWATDKTDIEIDTKPYPVSEDQPVRLQPNPVQCLVITMDAVSSSKGKGSLSIPGLKIRTDTMLDYERIVIYPDQAVHERLANLDNEEDEDNKEKDTLWNATYVTYENGKRVERSLIKDRSEQKKTDVTNAQSMITKVMSTVKYSGVERTISPEVLQGKAWVLDFLTYRVTADTLWVRGAPDPKSTRIGYLRKNDVVEVLGFNVGAGWTRLRRLSDGLTGWSSSTYLSQIPEISSHGEQYRVTAEKALNVRKGPGAEFGILGHVRRDEIVTAIGVNDKDTWRRIVTREGLIGWSSARYMALVQPPLPEPSSMVRSKPGEIRAAEREVAPLKTLLPAISELTPQVRFREISQEDVQTLLARAESPDAKLAQDFWSDIGDAFESAGSFFVTAFEETVAFVIDIGGRVIKWIVDTAEKAIAVVEGIIEKIGAAIAETIKWLRFLFDWEDILDTRDYLYKTVIDALDYAGRALPELAQGPVSEFLQEKKDLILKWFDDAIEALGGSPSETPSVSSARGLEMPDELNWIVSKVTGGLGSLVPGNTLPIKISADPAGEAALQGFWNGTLAEAAETFSKTLVDLPDTMIDLVEQLDSPRRALAALLQWIRDQLAGLLELGEKIILGLFDLAGYLCRKIKEILSTDLYIPLLSELLDWIGDLLGVDLNFSILDVATLILAIPVTIISKAAFGDAPFKNVPALALGVDAAVSGLAITAGVAGCVGTCFSFALDIQPEKETQPLWEAVLEVLSFACAVVGGAAGWTAAGLDHELDPDADDANWWLTLILVNYDSAIVLADGACVLFRYRTSKIVERFKRGNKVTIPIASGLGIVHLVLFLARGINKEKEHVENYLPDCIMTLPEIGSALRLHKNPQVARLGFGALDVIAGLAAIASIVITAVDA